MSNKLGLKKQIAKLTQERDDVLKAFNRILKQCEEANLDRDVKAARIIELGYEISMLRNKEKLCNT